MTAGDHATNDELRAAALRWLAAREAYRAPWTAERRTEMATAIEELARIAKGLRP